MKYGVILFNYGTLAARAAGYNLGDAIQTMAVYEAYKEIGISDSDILFVNMQSLKTYRGEKVILPIIGVGVIGEFAPPYSEDIIPLFISTHFVNNYLSVGEIEYLLKFAPIGCRDEYSFNTMQRYHIPAYLSGCITVLFHSKQKRENKGIYLIDAPDSLKKYIPEQINKEEIIEDTHLLELKTDLMTDNEAMKYIEFSRARLDAYENAKMVISSRMHALVPAMTLGTPIIGVFNNISYRFSWLDKFIELYSEKKFPTINWNPKPINTHTVRELFMAVFKASIFDNGNTLEKGNLLTTFYLDRNKSDYGNYYRDKITSFFEDEVLFDYAIWGCGLIGNTVWTIMQERYPQAKLAFAIDSFYDSLWQGATVVKPNMLDQLNRTKVIIATYSGREQAFVTLQQLGYKENIDFIFVATTSG